MASIVLRTRVISRVEYRDFSILWNVVRVGVRHSLVGLLTEVCFLIDFHAVNELLVIFSLTLTLLYL